MKNPQTIVDNYIYNNLDKEFERIQQYNYTDLKIQPTERSCINEFNSLIHTDKQWTFSNIVRRFHKSICFSNRRGYVSPYDGWEKIKSDKTLFEKLLRNRLTYNESFIKNGIPRNIPLHVYSYGMNTMKLFPEVSYFKPSTAKYLINKYISDANWIIDPFSGYSGRMLGAIATGKNYCGSDLCELSISESEDTYNWIKQTFNTTNKIYLECSDAETLKTNDFDALFTCPPYENIESWPGVNTNIHTCDDWIDICIQQHKCKKYLFIVDDKIVKWKDNVVEVLENKSHFGKNNEYVVYIKR